MRGRSFIRDAAYCKKEYGKYAIGVDDAPMISAVVPGVMGQTGMESAEIVRGIVSETNPDVIIAVDALAARNSKRLNRTIQIADTGIHPEVEWGITETDDNRNIRSTCYRNRCADSCRRGNDCK